VTPRKDREDYGGDTQKLVLAFFPSEDLADEAAMVLKNWEKASEHMKVDGVGVLVKDENGEVKEHKLGKRAGKKGMGIGVALGVVAAIPTGGLSLLGGAAGGAVGGGVIGEFFHKGLKMSDEDATRIASELDAGRAAVGVLAWDFESEAVADKLKEVGGTPQIHEVAKLPPRAFRSRRALPRDTRVVLSKPPLPAPRRSTGPGQPSFDSSGCLPLCEPHSAGARAARTP
jgi:uncharacterized membrane protein